MKDTLFIALQRLLPHHLVSRLIGQLAASETPFIKQQFITRFAKHYGVNMSEAAIEALSQYRSFNDFFTRALKADARPLCNEPHAIVSPADGAISQMGRIESGRIFQAKGQHFSVAELTACDRSAKTFANGQFMTVYLSPKDYHRVHMPLAGTLRKMTFVPGKLFSVNQTTAEHVPKLFARNERVVCEFETEAGPMVVVLVGAMIVASIQTVWAGTVAPLQSRIHTTHYPGTAPTLEKGAEMGRFLLGSTAVVLLPEGAADWTPDLTAGSPVQMGQKIGRLRT